MQADPVGRAFRMCAKGQRHGLGLGPPLRSCVLAGCRASLRVGLLLGQRRPHVSLDVLGVAQVQAPGE